MSVPSWCEHLRFFMNILFRKAFYINFPQILIFFNVVEISLLH